MAGLSETEELELLELENENALVAQKKASGLKDAPNDPAPGLLERAAPTISAIARPTLEVGGALGGGALATAFAAPTGPGMLLAAPAGGALGYAGGKSAADLLDRGLGLKPPLATAGAAVLETAGNMQEGAESEAWGLGMGAVLRAAGKGIMRAAPTAGKQVLSDNFGPSVEAIETRFARNDEVRAAKPLDVLGREFAGDANKIAKEVSKRINKALGTPELAAVRAAKPLDVLARELPEGVNELSKTVSRLSTAALNELPQSIKSGPIRRDEILQRIIEQSERLGDGPSDATANANKALGRYFDRMSRMPERLSQNEVGRFIRDFDHDINWDRPELEQANNALQGLRITIDEALKTKNPAYAAAMLPTAEATDILVKARQMFGLKKGAGGGFSAGNNTATALKSALGDTRFDSHGVLAGLKKYTGRDYLKEVEHSLTADKFKTSEGLDELLAAGDPRYAKALRPVAEGRALLKKIQQAFSLKEDFGDKLKAGDHTAGALQRAIEEKHVDTQDALAALKKLTGRDYLREVENRLTAEKFHNGKAQGSRRSGPITTLGTSIGGGVGALLGGPVGAVAGMAVGGVPAYFAGLRLDKKGHEYAGGIIDELVKLSQKSQGNMPSKALQDVIAQALQRTAGAGGVSYFKRPEGNKR